MFKSLLSMLTAPKRFILINKHNWSPVTINICGDKYIIIVNRAYFATPSKEFFTLKEKLYMLEQPLSVAWAPISIVSILSLRLRYGLISPDNLKVKIKGSKGIVYVAK
jgi:hypothetical protein